MCKAKLEEVLHPTFKVMDVLVDGQNVTINFNEFEINKKVFKVKLASKLINFSKIKPINPEDKVYLDYVQKEYGLIAGQQILAQKQAEKNLSKRRVA